MAALEEPRTRARALAGPNRVQVANRSWRVLQPGARFDATLVLRIGLAVLFAANAAVPWIDPADFTRLLAASGFDRLVDAWVFVWAIRVNDVVMAFALLVAWSRWPRFVPAWAGLYLLTVGAVKVAALA